MEQLFDIWRDEAGVPHIEAEDEQGLFQGLGYAHGHDRGMQTIFMRILGQGRVSECLTSDVTSFGVDTYFRRMNWSGNMDGVLDGLSPQARLMVNSYSAGLNHALQKKPSDVLGFLGHAPELWTPQDTVQIIRMTGYLTLAQSQAEMERLFIEMVQAGLPDDKLNELFPGILEGMDRDLINKIDLEEPIVKPSDLWETGAPRMMASNNWVISGKHTQSGNAVLANDPHLETNRLPNIWYEAVLRTKDRWAAGSSMPGIPAILVGRIKDISIGATYTFMDTVDSWVEKCKDGQYYREGEGWKDFSVRKELIRRKKRLPVPITIYENEHGVLEGDPMGEDECYLLTTNWTGSTAGAESLNAIAEVWQSDTVEDAMKAISGATISFSWVMADTQGSIGMQFSGKAPKRKKGARGFVPLAGWLPENDWQGMLDPGDLPSLLNPESGIIVTSNNDLNALGKVPVINMPMAPYRADRIAKLLSEGTEHDAAKMNRIQGDLYSLEAEQFMEVLRPLLPDTEAGRILAEWDLCYTEDSRGAYLFERFYQALRSEIFGRNGFGEDAEIFIARQTGIYVDFYLNFNRILLAAESAWLGDESREDLYRRVARESLDDTILTLGETRKVTMKHIIFGGILPRFVGFDRGPIVLPGSRATVQQGQIYRSAGRTTTFAPSLRLATDMGSNEVYSNLCGGPSDRRFNRWYVSNMKRWLANEYKTLTPDYAGRRLRL